MSATESNCFEPSALFQETCRLNFPSRIAVSICCAFNVSRIDPANLEIAGVRIMKRRAEQSSRRQINSRNMAASETKDERQRKNVASDRNQKQSANGWDQVRIKAGLTSQIAFTAVRHIHLRRSWWSSISTAQNFTRRSFTLPLKLYSESESRLRTSNSS